MTLISHLTVKLKAATLIFSKEDLLEVITTPDYEASVEDIAEINNETTAFFGDRKHYLLVITSQGSSSTPEAREFAAKESSRKNIVAEAIVINNIALRMAATVYMKVNRPKQKIKLFNSREKALRWIEQVKEKSNALG